MKNYNVAILGFGLSGSTFHAPLITSTVGFNLICILSGNSVKVHEKYPEVKVVATLSAILADPAIDLVINTLPNSLHYQVTKECLQAGKHVIVEKPFVVNLKEGRELIDLAQSQDLLLSVYHNRRWDNGFLTLQNCLKQNQLGRIHLYQAYFDRYRPQVNAGRWREQSGPGSGILYDLGSHLIDQALFLFGRPQAVFADLAIQREGSNAVDYFNLNLYYPGLQVILGSSSLMLNPRPVIAVYGEKGSYVKIGLDPQENHLRSGLAPNDLGYGCEDPDLAGTLSFCQDDSLLISAKPINSLVGCYQKYYQKIWHSLNSKSPIPVSADSALQVIEIIEKCIENACLRKIANL